MKKILVALFVVFSLVMTVSAHSGRTDSSGGHKDNKNASGLGSYHYHCGGYSAHLHTNGYCPYTDTFPTSVKVSADKTTLAVGDKTTLTGTVSPSDACNTDVSWKSSDSKIISIKNGVATAIGPGTATITATTFNDIEATLAIKVEEIPAERIEIECAGPLIVGGKGNISASVYPENATDQDITWSVSDEKIATVDKDGNIIAHAAGEVVIKATQKDTSAEITVQVMAKSTEPQTYKPSEKTTDPTSSNTLLPLNDPAETDTEESEGSALLGFVVIAVIVGIVILVKRKR